MKKIFIGISVVMVSLGIIIAGCEHQDEMIQLILCTSGVLLMGGGTLLSMVVTA